MKKTIIGFISGIVLTILAIFLITPSLAANTAQQIMASLGVFNVAVNGKMVCSIGDAYSLNDKDTTPYCIVYNNTTYLALRPLADAINYNIEYTEASKTVHMYSKKLTEPLDDSTDDTKRDTTIITDKSLIESKDTGSKTDLNTTESSNYDNFLSSWDIRFWNQNDDHISYWAQYNGKLTREETLQYLKDNNKYVALLFHNYATEVDKSKFSGSFVMNIAFFHDSQSWKDRLGYVTSIVYDNDYNPIMLIND
jgi:hypothetical protein